MMNSESKFAMKAKRPSQSFPQNISHCAVAALATEITATVPSGATTGAVSGGYVLWDTQQQPAIPDDEVVYCQPVRP
jgi:hypothetical protein